MKSLQWIAQKNVWQHAQTALTVVMLSQFLTESVRLEIYKVFNLQVTISNILRSETKIKDCVEINAAIRIRRRAVESFCADAES